MKPARHPLILAGAGHAHLVAIRRWIKNQYRPPQGTILLSPNTQAWYSGMMPGLIAGRFTKDECAIELEPLCKACGIELVIGEIVELDAANRRVKLSNHQALEYDHLSLNVGSVPPLPNIDDNSVEVVPAKPFGAFNRKWQAWQAHESPTHLAVLGGGAAAFELALALQKSLPLAQLSVMCSGDLLNGYSSGLQKRALKTLSERGIEVCNNTLIDCITDGWLISENKQIREVDALVVATGAAALAWQSGSGLQCNSTGFITVSANLQSKSHPEVLASGDCANQAGTPHSGVYAVRQGAVLSDIIPALLKGESLKEYKPQANALALLSTADGKALMNYGRFSGGGRLFGLYKDYLDLSFMRRHRLA